MIFNKLNAGCGYDIKQEPGWLNVDTEFRHVGENFRLWDITESPTQLEYDLTERFRFILLNHVLMSMNPYKVHQALINLHRTLKPGGKLQVIDMDILKVFDAYEKRLDKQIPIEDGTLDEKFCMAVSGYGTRDSVFTPAYLCQVLEEAGFRKTEIILESEYDSRPLESVIVEATK